MPLVKCLQYGDLKFWYAAAASPQLFPVDACNTWVTANEVQKGSGGWYKIPETTRANFEKKCALYRGGFKEFSHLFPKKPE